MDVFGSTPARKLDKLIEEVNRDLENKLTRHAESIDVNSEKIENIFVIAHGLENKIKLLENACLRIETSVSEIERKNSRFIIDEIRLQLGRISGDTDSIKGGTSEKISSV